MIEALQKLVPALVDLQTIPKAILSVLIVVLAAFCLAVLWIQPTKKDGAAAKPELGKMSYWADGQWPKTRDFVIDQTIERVNRLRGMPNPSDADIVSALQPIFHKPIFVHLAEEPDPGRALFTFCKAQQLLTVYQLKISSPSIRELFRQSNPKSHQFAR